MPHLQCKCSKDATLVCLNHKEYLCEHDAKYHPCKLTNITSFIRKTRLAKKDLCNSLKALKFENRKNEEKLSFVNRQMINELVVLKDSINHTLGKLINLYNKRIEGLIEYEMKSEITEIERNLSDFESDQEYIRMHFYLKKLLYGKIRKKERDRAKEISKNLVKDSLVCDLNKFLTSVKSQSKLIYSTMEEAQLDNIDDMKRTRVTMLRKISETVAEENKVFLKNSMIYQRVQKNMANTRASILETKIISNFNTHFTPERSSILNNNFRSYQSEYKRGSDLIDSTLINRLRDTSIQELSHKKENSFEVIEENRDELSLNPSSIEEDESNYEDFSSDGDQNYMDEVFENYELAKNDLIALMGKGLMEINKANFFNRKNKTSVNTYFKSYIENLKNNVQTLLLNFNKL